MDIPEITDIDDTSRSLRLKWRPKSMSPFNKGPITYQIERWEPTQRHWTRVASGVRDTTYKVTGLPFDQDHLFRIRAEAEKLLSEPTYPISFNRFRCKSTVFCPCHINLCLLGFVMAFRRTGTINAFKIFSLSEKFPIPMIENEL